MPLFAYGWPLKQGDYKDLPGSEHRWEGKQFRAEPLGISTWKLQDMQMTGQARSPGSTWKSRRKVEV